MPAILCLMIAKAGDMANRKPCWTASVFNVCPRDIVQFCHGKEGNKHIRLGTQSEGESEKNASTGKIRQMKKQIWRGMQEGRTQTLPVSRRGANKTHSPSGT